MPPSSRKRNKGKDRKAKQQAKKEENEKLRARYIWQTWVNPCNHGCTVKVPDEHPVSQFMDGYFTDWYSTSSSEKLSATMEKHSDVWNNKKWREMVIDIMVRIGTNMLLKGKLQGRDITTWPACVAESIIALENFSDDMVSVAQSGFTRVVASKRRDLTCGTGSIKRDCLKFYRKRITCTCLKSMHLEARKTEPKRGTHMS